MAPQRCPNCGGPNASGALYCQYCGAPLPAVPGTPLRSGQGGYLPPPPPGWPGQPFQAPPYPASPYIRPGVPEPRRRIWVWVIVALVAASVIIAAEGLVIFSVPSTVHVTGIDIVSADNACGLDHATAAGFTANLSQVVGLDFAVTGNATAGGGTAPCSITAVNSATSSFAIRAANVPLSIPANATVTLAVTVACPSAPFSGILTLSLT